MVDQPPTAGRKPLESVDAIAWNQWTRSHGITGRNALEYPQLAHELGPWNITVNNVAPGFVRSNPTTERRWQFYGEEGQRALERIALRRLGTPEDIANAVLFFASPYADWVTGQVLSVDGGR